MNVDPTRARQEPAGRQDVAGALQSERHDGQIRDTLESDVYRLFFPERVPDGDADVAQGMLEGSGSDPVNVDSSERRARDGCLQLALIRR